MKDLEARFSEWAAVVHLPDEDRVPARGAFAAGVQAARKPWHESFTQAVCTLATLALIAYCVTLWWGHR